MNRLSRVELGLDRPMVIRLVGTNDKEAYEILAQAGLAACPDMTEAVRKAVAAV